MAQAVQGRTRNVPVEARSEKQKLRRTVALSQLRDMFSIHD